MNRQKPFYIPTCRCWRCLGTTRRNERKRNLIDITACSIFAIALVTFCLWSIATTP